METSWAQWVKDLAKYFSLESLLILLKNVVYSILVDFTLKNSFADFAVEFPQQTEFSNIYPPPRQPMNVRCFPSVSSDTLQVSRNSRDQSWPWTLSVLFERTLAMPWPRRCYAGLSTRMPGFDPTSLHAEFLLDKRGHWEKTLSQNFRFPLSVWLQQWTTLFHLSPTLYNLNNS